MKKYSTTSLNNIYWKKWWKEWPNFQYFQGEGNNLRPSGYLPDNHGNLIINALGLDSTKEVLDAGCGNGSLAKYISPIVKHITGIDYSERMIEVATRNVEGYHNITLEKMDITKLKFPENSFDAIYCMGVFEYLSTEKYPKVINAFQKIIKPGGFILVGDIIPCCERYLDKKVSMMNPDSWKIGSIINSDYEGRYHVLIKC